MYSLCDKCKKIAVYLLQLADASVKWKHTNWKRINKPKTWSYVSAKVIPENIEQLEFSIHTKTIQDNCEKCNFSHRITSSSDIIYSHCLNMFSFCPLTQLQNAIMQKSKKFFTLIQVTVLYRRSFTTEMKMTQKQIFFSVIHKLKTQIAKNRVRNETREQKWSSVN